MKFAAIVSVLVTMAALQIAAATDFGGRVTFSSVAVPGATVTATHGDRVLTTVSGEDGAFHFADLDDGAWTIRVEMRGFLTATHDVTLPLPADAEPLAFDLTMRPYAEMAALAPKPAPTPAPVASAQPADAAAAQPDQVDIITGSVINGATTVYAQPRAFGNNRPRLSSLYNFAGVAVIGSSAWNATPYSFIEPSAPAPSYGNLQLGFNMAGPLRIPWLVKYGPNMTLGYQHGSTHNATTLSAVVPTAAERAGDFSSLATPIRNPITG